MTRAAPRSTRRGFTLVELLVVMAVIILLTSMAVIVVPGVMSQDRTVDATGTVYQYLLIAQSRATRDNKPYGIRFVTGPDPTNTARTNPQWATEIQFVEGRDPIVPNPTGVVSAGAPYVEFEYTLDPTGAVAARKCYLMGLPRATSEVSQVIESDLVLSLQPMLAIPPLGVGPVDARTFAITAITPAAGTRATGDNSSWEVTLATYPDPQVGAGTLLRVYQFGLWPGAVPLLGEPTIQLPKNICVDLPSSSPAGVDTVLFTPGGPVKGATAAAYFFWVRDYTKNGGVGGDFTQGGDQKLVAVKTINGSVGQFPIMEPPYGAGQDAYTYARLGLP